MTDKEFRKQRKRVHKAVLRLRNKLGLAAWFVDLRYHPGPYEIDGTLNAEAAASCHVLWEYRQATMSFNLTKVADLDREELEAVVIHEAMHIYLHEMREPDADLKHEEHVATSLAWVICWCLGTKVF